MIRKWLVVLLVALTALTGSISAGAQSAVHFRSEGEAQRSCPSDIVVWVNTSSGIYHFRGQRWYGATKAGAYICRKAADGTGYRATRNGQ